MNSYIRFKLALTENEPTIKPYMENVWAELPEAKQAPIEISLALLNSLHQRWMLMLRNDADWQRSDFRHPELGPMLTGKESSSVLLAWTPSHRARDDPAREDGMVEGST